MKLGEIEATKGKSGDYYGIDEILGEEIEIIEAVTADSEIREYKTKPKDGKQPNMYYCVLIRHGEEKDLHLTKAALLAVAAALPKAESWMNYKLRINRTGSGFTTAYKVVITGKGISGFTQPETAQIDVMSGILAKVKSLKNVSDERLEMIAEVVAGEKGRGDFALKILKSEGKIHQDKERGWVVS